MKFSWTSLKISIAGAKLSHLVQKDKIWDHGSMTEQARIIFYLVHKAKTSKNLDSLRRQCTDSCFMKLKNQVENRQESGLAKGNPVISELAIIDVQPGKNNKPDMFTALIRGYNRKVKDERYGDQHHLDSFSAKWAFIRHGDWWMLNSIKQKI